MFKQNYLYIPPLISNNVAVHPNFLPLLYNTFSYPQETYFRGHFALVEVLPPATSFCLPAKPIIGWQ